MSALPYMPLYVADYLADTAHLTALENGAYMMLLMNYWQRGKALPGGDKQLARIARLTDDEWSDVKPALQEFFDVVEGEWTHGRVERELDKVKAKSEQASSAGRASVQRKTNGRSTDVQRKTNGRSTDVQRTFNHTDTDTDTDTDTKKEREKGHRARAQEILKDREFRLDGWEDGFLANIAGRKTLTPDQAQSFATIVARHEARNSTEAVPFVSSGYFVEHETPEMAAWEKHNGKPLPRSESHVDGKLKRGWFRPSQWPPGHQIDDHRKDKAA